MNRNHCSRWRFCDDAVSACRRQNERDRTTTEDLAALAREVGGDQVNVDSIARGYQDPHFVEPKPSFLLKLQKADLLVVVGLQLEIGWLPPLHHAEPQRQDPGRRPGLSRHVAFCQILEIPPGR